MTQPGSARAGVQAPADGDRGGRQPQDDVQSAAALRGLHKDPLGGEPDGQGRHRRPCAPACPALYLPGQCIRKLACMHSSPADVEALLAAKLRVPAVIYVKSTQYLAHCRAARVHGHGSNQ